MLDTSALDLSWSSIPNRFHVGSASGVSASAISFSRTTSTLTLSFEPGAFAAGGAFRFGMSVFSPVLGSTQQYPDRFRGMAVTVVLDDGRSFTGNVFAGPKEPINRFTGFGLVNADAAVRRVQHTPSVDPAEDLARPIGGLAPGYEELLQLLGEQPGQRAGDRGHAPNYANFAPRTWG